MCFHIHMSLPFGLESHHPINTDGRDFFNHLEHHMCWMKLSTAHQWNKLQSHMNTDRWLKVQLHPSLNKLQLWWASWGTEESLAQQHMGTIHCTCVAHGALPNCLDIIWKLFGFHWILLDAVGCCWMLLDVSGCSWMLLDAIGCCWMLMDVVGCCWMLLDAVGCCGMLWVPHEAHEE